MKIKDQYKKAAIVVVGLAVLAIGFSAGRTLTPPADKMARMETAAEAEYRSGDEADAFALFTQLAERGSIPAATYLGEMYQTGTGTATRLDPSRATPRRRKRSAPFYRSR